MPTAIIIGSGFAGLSTATFLARDGWDVTVLEKHDIPGGRARQFEANGFTFDMGPSWYWMPDIFERYFNCFGKKVSDYYTLNRLDPSYRVYFNETELDIPADYNSLKKLFEQVESGSGVMLDRFMEEAAYKYQVGINKLVFKPGRSLSEFMDMDLLKGLFRLDVFTSISEHVRRHFKDSRLIELMEFPVLFLGALPEKIPALYSLMNYADVRLGTWYPQGGMYKIVEGMHALAVEQGVSFRFDTEVSKLITKNGRISTVRTNQGDFNADVIISGADYHHTEADLLSQEDRSYSSQYWDKRVMAPSCLLYYVGINKKLKQVLHHSLFFDTDFSVHGKEIYQTIQWPSDPLFYVSMTTATDPSGAPAGSENLFFLIPVAAGLTGDTEDLRDTYFDRILSRFEQRIGENVRDHIVYKRSYSIQDFKKDYHAYKGNAYGLANTLLQTAILKPSCRSKRVSNLFYTGQLTVPGPGVPPSLISGEVVAGQVNKYFSSAKKQTEYDASFS